MKTWLKRGLIGSVAGLFIGAWAMFYFALFGSEPPVWLHIINLDPILKTPHWFFYSIGLNRTLIYIYDILSVFLFFGIYFCAGVLIGFLVGKIKR